MRHANNSLIIRYRTCVIRNGFQVLSECETSVCDAFSTLSQLVNYDCAVMGAVSHCAVLGAVSHCAVLGAVSHLTLPTPKYFCINHGNQSVFSILNHHKCLIQLFQIHLNTYAMGLRPLLII